VRVVFAQHFADDARGFLVRPIRAQVHVVHRVEDAPLHRLEAVPRVGERARHDDRHRVRQVRGLHLVIYVDLADQADFHALPRDARRAAGDGS